MSRWARYAMWAAGSCVVWCPVCVCLSGGGAWWVCACVVGLVTVTLGSGYTTWTVFNNLLCHGPHSYPLFAKCFRVLERFVERGQTPHAASHDSPRPHKPGTTKAVMGSPERCSVGTSYELILQEVIASAGSLHSFLILPWYSKVSPDTHFSYQIKDVLEEMLTNMFQRVQEAGNVTRLAAGIVQLYLQHYRQYQRALKKASKKHKDIESVSKTSSQEIQTKYKALHPALKNPETLKLYYRKLAQILLQHYLPVEVTRCDLILISLRDLFAQNVLQAFVDLLCDTQWLNTKLSEILSGVIEDTADWAEPQKCSQRKDENTQASKPVSEIKNALQILLEEKVMHSNLPSIEEETLSDLQQLDPASPQSTQPAPTSPQQLDTCRDRVEEKKFENAEELVEYVRSSSLEKKESSEEEDYRSVSSALGTLISTTAGPLLPDSSSPPFHPLVNKMWESPVEDKCFVDIATVKKKKNPFSRSVVEGMKEEEYKLMYYIAKDDKTKLSPTSPAFVAECSIVPKLSEASKSIEIKIEDSECVKKDSNKCFLVPSIGDIIRSKSCGNLAVVETSTGKSLTAESKSLHSSLIKLDQPEDQNTWSTDASDDVNCDDIGSRKEKGHLVKMLSFDKNDGIDEASIENSMLDAKDESIAKDNQSEWLPGNQPQEATSQDTARTEQDQPTSTEPSVENKSDLEHPSTLEIPSSPPLGNAGFGWENPDLSPIYEESEDLASSIAKLRSLLTERESQHSLGSLSSYGSSDSEPKSAQSDPGRYNLEKSRFTFTHKDSSGSLASVKSVSSLESCGNGITDEEPLEAAEIPLDGRVFLSVSVPQTEVQTEPGGTQYTLYTIQYDAIYLCESPTTIALTSETGEEGSAEPPPSEPRMVLQTNCVKRRFREFLRLHAALEEDTRLRAAMKGVKGPNKWLNLPFSKLDSTTIATRKQFLEKYLQSVIQRPEVNISNPVKEFLAYGLDSSVSFVKKPLELHVPRLDKLLAKTVSGVFHSLKTALPSFESSDSQGSSAEGQASGGGVGTASGGDKGKLSSGALTERNKLAAFLSSTTKGEYELKLDITAEDEECQIEEALVREVSGGGSVDESIDTAYEAKETRSGTQAPLSYSQLHAQYQQQQEQKQQQHHQHSVVLGWSHYSGEGSGGIGGGGVGSAYPCLPPPGPRLQGDGCDGEALSRRSSNQDSLSGEEGGGLWEDCPLAVSLLDVAVEVLAPPDHPLTRQPCVTLIALTFASITHKWLKTELERMFSEANTAEYIQVLREAVLSPPPQPSPPPSPAEIQQSRARLHQTLMDFIPGAVETGVGRAVDSLQHPTLMADLALHLLDLIAAQLLPPSAATP